MEESGDDNIIDESKLINVGLVEKQMTKGTAICEEYAKGTFTIDSCCGNQGVSYSTFNLWCIENEELRLLFKRAKSEAEENNRRELKQKCATSLMKLVEGFSVEEIHQSGTPLFDKDGNQVGMKNGAVKRIKKHFAPNVTAIIFALKALDPDTYKDNIPPIQAEEQIFIVGGKEVKF